MASPTVIPIGTRLDEATVCTIARGLAAGTTASVIVIEGEPERFCLGMDFAQAIAGQPAQLEPFARLIGSLLRSPRPTLAVIDGPTLGGGLGVAAACDFVLATERATFGLPEGLYGLAPAIIRPALLTRLSPQQLRLLVMTCHSRSASQAAALGLVDEVVAVGDLERARRSAIRRLARVRTETVVACRRLEHGELDHQLNAGVTETAAALATETVVEALRAFTAEEQLPWV
ncbi:MAG: liuC [Myxococcales bacterium]|nr:liuC [Myxococcales bacterium]